MRISDWSSDVCSSDLLIPCTLARYPKQQTNPIKLICAFKGYVRILWSDKLGQISLAVTTLFWGAGATLQFIVIEWGARHLGYRLDQASILMGVAALGTVIGARDRKSTRMYSSQ